MRRTALRALLLLFTLSATGCDLLLSPVFSGPLSVSPARNSFVMENRGERDIFYFAVEQHTAALINWGPCDRPADCPRVPARGRTTVPYDSIGGFGPEATTAIIYWWHLVPDGAGGHRPDEIRHLHADFAR
jgi:hypothetical protein